MTAPSASWPHSLVLAGAGKMGGALLRGWLAGGLAPACVCVLDPHLDHATTTFCRDAGVSLEPPVASPQALVLAVKPQAFAAAAGDFARLAQRQTLVVSILAGMTLGRLRAGLPNAGAIVRAMPNLPASVGQGVSGVAAEAVLRPAQRAMAQALLGAVGHVEWLDEGLMDAVTAVSGSGPAYVFYLVECLAAAGIAAGLPPDVAGRLARATVEGAGALMQHEPERSAADMRRAVTSPGGTTAAALEVLQANDALMALMRQAIDAASRRGAELADTSSAPKTPPAP